MDLYQQITDQIVSAIESGAGDYQMPWNSRISGQGSLPVNVASGKFYRGINVLELWAAAQEKGYSSNEWGTYQQWQSKGAQVRKGEKSTHVVFWKFWNAGESQEDGEGSDTPTKQRCMARGYCVFNAAQVDGYESKTPEAPMPEPNARISAAEAFIASTGATVRHGGNRAYYSPASDHVQMPPFEAFPQPEKYYSVISHELTHWSGPRLKRDMTGRFGSETYAMEELVAELGAAFACGSLGIALDPRTDHAPYISNWLTVLKRDKRAIFTAASKAQQAADFLLQHEQPTVEMPVAA